MISIEHSRDEDMIVVRVSDTLTARDYDLAVPELRTAMDLAQGPLRVLIRLEDFHGWQIGALWKELKFDVRHSDDLGRIAVVGETRLEAWATLLSAPFAGAQMRFFPAGNEDAARAWLAAAD